MIKTANLQLIPCELTHLEAILRDKKELEPLLQVTVPESWPHFPEVFPYVYEILKSDPSLLEWWTYLFIHSGDRVLVGLGGYKGRPDESGTVEMGYEIVPEYMGRGLATEAARGMLRFAFSHDEVTAVQAHTLPEKNASNTILQRLGLRYVEAVQDPEDGLVWKFRISRDEYPQPDGR